MDITGEITLEAPQEMYGPLSTTQRMQMPREIRFGRNQVVVAEIIDQWYGSDYRYIKANNPQQSWGFEGEPPEAVIKDSGRRDGTS